MASSFIHDLLVHGIAAAKANDRTEAKQLLERALSLDLDTQEEIEALYWLSEVCDDPKQQRDYLETLLAMDMSDGRARRKLAILNGQIKPEEIIDPNLPQPIIISDPQSIDAKRYVCPQCGGRMVFRPDGQSLVCEYCDSKPKPQVSDNPGFAEEQDFFVALATSKGHYKIVATRIFICKGCASSFILPPTQLTLTCPYCLSPYVVQDQNNKEFVSPTGIIPFIISETQAKLILKAWLQKKLKDQPVRVHQGHGIYIPVWTFDIAGDVRYHYRVYHDKQWIDLSGTDSILNNDIPIAATKNADRIWQEQIQRYDLLKTIEYKDDYLANWPAETYQIAVSDASLKARERVFLAEKEHVKQIIGGQFEDLSITSEKIRVDSYKLVLLPLWVVFYSLNERQYKVTINGQTGHVVGETPARGLRKWVGKVFGSD